MSTLPRTLKACVVGFALLLSINSAFAQHYNQPNLVSNTGAAPTNDPNLQNAWGLVSGPAVGGGAGAPGWGATTRDRSLPFHSPTRHHRDNSAPPRHRTHPP